MAQQVEQKTEAAEPRLRLIYRQHVVPALMERFGYGNRLAAPRLIKITLNCGVGQATEDRKYLEEAVQALRVVSGQQPVTTRARKSVAGFHLREGVPIGCKVTLRRRRMYEFLDRLTSVVLPRIRDFHGLSPDSLDGTGNFSIGIREHFVFPEVNVDDFERTIGMDVSVCTSARTDEEALALLRLLGMPFRS